MSDHCSPAARDQISAVYVMNRLFITAIGTKPTPCYEVKVERSPLQIFPPAYVVEQCATATMICPQVITPYRAVGIFRTIPLRSVTVYHRDGHDVVPVQVIDDPAVDTVSGEPGRGGGSPAGIRLGNFLETGEASQITAPGSSERVQATGYSGSFSFTGAYEDAVRNLPPDPQPFPDKLITITVDAIGSEHGGFPGFNRLFVTVSTSY